MERTHVLAWPALQSADVDGWLWRCSGGRSQRANSVSTVAYRGGDVMASVLAVEERYAAVGAAARFHTYDGTVPQGLAELLRQRGYRETEATVTMCKPVSPPDEVVQVEIRDRAWEAWLQVYLAAVSENRRVVNRRILQSVPQPRAFAGCWMDGQVVATGLGVLASGCAVIECVATQVAARGRGAAGAVVAALERWAAEADADVVGLQVAIGNVAALRLYRGSGFVTTAVNRFWVLGSD